MRSFLLVAAALLIASPALAQPSAPLLDRELFFGDPEVSGAQLSPDGRFVSFMKLYNGVRNVWVKRVDEAFVDARPLTADTRPVGGASWSRDGAYLLYGQDKGGDENFHIYAVDPSAAADSATGVPPSRDVTPYGAIQASVVNAPREAPRTLVVGMNDRDPQLSDLYSVDLDTGVRTLVAQNPGGVLGWTFDRQDRLRLGLRTTPEGRIETVEVAPDGTPGRVVLSCTITETCGALAFTPDGDRFFATTNADARDLAELVTVDPATGETTFVERDPATEADLQNVLFDSQTGVITATIYEGDRTRIYWKRADDLADYAFLLERLAAEGFGESADVVPTSTTEDDRTWLVYAGSDVDPGAVYLFDRDARTLVLQYRSRPNLTPDVLAPRRPVRYASSDGLQIPAYLTTPRGTAPAGGWPLIVYPHGGPWARDSYGYDAVAQFLANRGYVVLQPNFRASTGYGKAFTDAGNGEWGRLMQDDLTFGVRHLVAEGLVDAAHVGIFGASYGGYATLAGLAFTPDVYAAGVSYVGPSNLFTLIEAFPAYWAPLLTRLYQQMADPNTPEGQQRLREMSPLFAADRIVDPLLVIQGANDPRVKQAESDQIVIALRDRGDAVQYLVAPDEGHGFRGRENRMAVYAALEAFMAKHVGGRVQTEIPADIAARLAALTVDPATVVLADAGAMEAAQTAALPAITRALPMGTGSYATTIAVGGQTIQVQTTRTVRMDGDALVVEETSTSAMGAGTDVLRLDARTLRPISRRIEQGPVVLTFDFADAAVTGTMAMNGQSQPVEVALAAPVLGDVAALGAVGMAPGDAAVFRTFDPATQKVAVYTATAEAMETVTVPGGTFEAVRVALTAADGASGAETLWFSTDGRLVKRTAVMPAMGGAVMTVEYAGSATAGG